jgi:hypothetical protein
VFFICFICFKPNTITSLFARPRALHNGASGGGPILAPAHALHFGASSEQISIQRAPSVYSATEGRFSAPIFAASAEDALTTLLRAGSSIASIGQRARTAERRVFWARPIHSGFLAKKAYHRDLRN